MYAFYQQKNNLYPVPQLAVDQACKHAMDEYPKESVGVVYNGCYIGITNVHPEPETDFKVDPKQYSELFVQYGPPQAVIHSHPQGEHYPSKEDQFSQMAANVPYGLIVLGGPREVKNVLFWGDDIPMAPAIGRPFVYGIYDCWATVRDAYYRDFGVHLNNYARNEDLLDPKKPDNYFMDYWPDAGFEQIDFAELRLGDVCLSRIFRQSKVNHCGYYLGDGTVIHHPFGTPQSPMLSRRDIIYKWKPFITHCFRHKDSKVAVQVPAQ